MSEGTCFTIEIPCDDDGFVLLQCPKCGELFKLKSESYESDDVLEVSCPSCGLSSDNYLTDDVIELAQAKAKNMAAKLVGKEMKKLEKKVKGVSVSLNSDFKLEEESILQPSVDALEIVCCEQCERMAKISKLLIMSSFVCPLCGVSNFNDQ